MFASGYDRCGQRNRPASLTYREWERTSGGLLSRCGSNRVSFKIIRQYLDLQPLWVKLRRSPGKYKTSGVGGGAEGIGAKADVELEYWLSHPSPESENNLGQVGLAPICSAVVR